MDLKSSNETKLISPRTPHETMQCMQDTHEKCKTVSSVIPPVHQ